MENLIELIVGLVFFVLPLLFAWAVGRVLERRHHADMVRREAALAGFRVSNLSTFPGGAGPKTPKLVVQGVCLSINYFRSFIAGIRKLFGGELSTYRTLAERTRREALLRVLEEARREGFSAVCNVRFDVTDVGASPHKKKKGSVTLEVIASGTAYQIAEQPPA